MQAFEVSGMTCGHCVRAVTEAVNAADPTAKVVVDLPAGRVTVQGGTAPPDRIAQALAAGGYPARPLAA